MSRAVAVGLLVLAAGPAVAAAPEDSVVRVTATTRWPNPLRPWTSGAVSDSSGSGTVIDGRRVLTNAHVVLYATDVQVQPRRGGGKVSAKVAWLNPDMDLAVLTVDDPKFFDKCPPLARSRKLPKVQDNVSVYGFPVGGTDLSVTKGVVSRIDFGQYYQTGQGLMLQVSAAVNPGNSGGPAVVGDKMVGLVWGRLSDQQNIGYLIPCEEIDLFLEDVKDGRYDGKWVEAAGTLLQRAENPTLRRFLKLDADARGMLLLPPRRPPAGYPFREFDLLTRIGPYDIDSDGMVQLPDDLRVNFYTVVDRLAKDGAVPVTVVRDGLPREEKLAVARGDHRLVRNFVGQKLPYFIHGPLVFAPATVDGLRLYRQARPDLFGLSGPLTARLADKVRFPGEELVVVTSPLFQHKITQGYDQPLGQVVASVNGKAVRNLAHLVELLRDSSDEYLTFRFAEEGAEVLVFRRDELERATDEILEDNGIRPGRRGSEEVMKVWEAKKGK